jgi:hypothetical protein
MTFALSLGAKARPGAFFTDDWMAGFYSRVHYQMTLGAGSEDKSKGETYGTSLWELCWEVAGYDWNILGNPKSPHVEGGVGFGMMGFSVDWGDSSDSPTLPGASYKFVLFSLGSYMPIYSLLSGHLRFDYRLVTGTGEIEKEDWYGPSSTGGINFVLGIDGTYRKFVASVEYTYTRYFFTFDKAKDHMAECEGPNPPTPCFAAGGALDVLHGIMVNFGYSY